MLLLYSVPYNRIPDFLGAQRNDLPPGTYRISGIPKGKELSLETALKKGLLASIATLFNEALASQSRVVVYMDGERPGRDIYCDFIPGTGSTVRTGPLAPDCSEFTTLTKITVLVGCKRGDGDGCGG